MKLEIGMGTRQYMNCIEKIDKSDFYILILKKCYLLEKMRIRKSYGNE
jgi:hypothetical protein